MSEEEKKAIEHTEIFCYGKQLWEEDLECIKTLLNLIEKQNNRLEQLEKERDYYFKQYQYHLNQNESLTREFSNSIPKSVIRDKIEELKQENEEIKENEFINCSNANTIKIKLLKEILGDE